MKNKSDHIDDLETSQIDLLFLELAQITKAKTFKEVELGKENARLHSIGNRLKRQLVELAGLIDGQTCIASKENFGGETCEQRHVRVMRELYDATTGMEKRTMEVCREFCIVCQMKRRARAIQIKHVEV